MINLSSTAFYKYNYNYSVFIFSFQYWTKQTSITNGLHTSCPQMLCWMSQMLQQQKYVLQRRLDMNELASGQKEAELNGDLAALRSELDRHHIHGRDRRRDESEQLTQLSNHNQRLVEQLSEVCFTSSPIEQVSILKSRWAFWWCSCVLNLLPGNTQWEQCRQTGSGSLILWTVCQLFPSRLWR